MQQLGGIRTDFLTAFRNLTFPSHSDHLSKAVLKYIEHMRKETLTIAFCGTFKSGKSSLINALLGVRLLPTRVTSATAVITRVFYSDAPTAYVIRSGSTQKEMIPIDDTASYILIEEKTLQGIRTKMIEEVGIGIPNALLKNHVTLVDTPGLDDDNRLSDITFKELEKVDLAVMVYNATKFMSMDERRAASRIADLLGGNVIFAMNRMDVVTDKESLAEVADYYLSGYGNLFVGKGTIVYTSAGDEKQDIGELRKQFVHLTGTEKKLKIAFNARLYILHQKLETLLHEMLNKREVYRLDYEKHERIYAAGFINASEDLRSKMMQLSLRLNNVRYNINAYIDPFKNMCIHIAKGEGLLRDDNFNTYQLALCIEKTMEAFVMEFIKKIKRLLAEFSISIPVDFKIRPVTTSAKIDRYLTGALRTKNRLFGDIASNILDNDTFNELSRLISGSQPEKYMMAYVMSVEEECSRLKQQIGMTLDQMEQKIIKYADDHKPVKIVPAELKNIQRLMDEADTDIQWYRQCITQVRTLLEFAENISN